MVTKRLSLGGLTSEISLFFLLSDVLIIIKACLALDLTLAFDFPLQWMQGKEREQACVFTVGVTVEGEHCGL